MATILELLQLTPQQLVYELALPFIITLAIFFGILQMVGIFRRNINLVVALGVTILAATTPQFSMVSQWLSHYTAYTVLAAFLIVFVIGIGTWTFRKGREYTTGVRMEEHNLERQIRKLENKLRTEGNPDKRMHIARELSELRRIQNEIRYSR